MDPITLLKLQAASEYEARELRAAGDAVRRLEIKIERIKADVGRAEESLAHARAQATSLAERVTLARAAYESAAAELGVQVNPDVASAAGEGA